MFRLKEKARVICRNLLLCHSIKQLFIQLMKDLFIV
jgi:hypothetical protein